MTKQEQVPSQPTAKPTRRNYIVRQVLSVVFFVLAVALFTFVALFAIDSKNRDDIYILGYKPFIIASGSMEPKYKTNSFILIKRADISSAKVGDTIAFRSEAMSNNIVFHRVVKVVDDGLVTKGDNNSHNDSGLVRKDKFLGKEVFHTNIAAQYVTNLKSPGGLVRYGLIPILVIVLVLVLIWLAIKWIRSGRKKPQQNADDDDSQAP